MFPQSWSLCGLRPKFKRRRLSQIPTPRVDIWFPPGSLCDRRHGAGPPRRWRYPRAERSRFVAAPRSVDAATPDPPRGGRRWLHVRTRFGRSRTGCLPPIARLRARLAHLRRRTGRARRWLSSRDFYAFGNFELLDGKFCSYPLY